MMAEMWCKTEWKETSCACRQRKRILSGVTVMRVLPWLATKGKWYSRSFIVPYTRCKKLKLHALACNILKLHAVCQHGTPWVVSASVLLMLLANPFGSESFCVLVCSLVIFISEWLVSTHSCFCL